MISFVQFVDCVVLGKDAHCSSLMSWVVEEAMARHIPVVSEDCIGELAGCLY